MQDLEACCLSGVGPGDIWPTDGRWNATDQECGPKELGSAAFAMAGLVGAPDPSRITSVLRKGKPLEELQDVRSPLVTPSDDVALD